uniref:Putative gag protein n=1 Tax=Zea mays TaxID=4577 RepID=Q8S480_MAIZE|nr:putative gag protein [Zea mays]
MELIEGELGRFAMKKGEGPQAWLKSLMNQVRNYGSKKWTDHEVIQLMLRSFTVIGPTLVSLIHENPRYKKMVHEEVLGKFVSHQMMVKDAKCIGDLAHGNTSSTKS